MSENPNKLTQFWQELKRRKVIHVITVYASASFVLIELINNVQEPLNLPQGLSTIAIVVLAIGFPFAVVISWIFDVGPKGVEKTRPVSEVSEKEKTVTPNSWKIATYISAVVIVGLISFNLITRTNLSENLSLYGKSVAILPFINDNHNEEDEVLINGTMVSIINKLSGIKVMMVKSRDAVEQFRDTIVPVEDICEDLGVSYVLKTYIRKYGNRYVINPQLVDQNNKTVWSGQFDRDIHDMEAKFDLESTIAHEVAKQIKATISPEEEQLINKIPTTDPMAYQLCLEADNDCMEFIHSGNSEYRQSADQKYRQALTFDSTYAKAIAGLGWLYLFSNQYGDRSQETFLDSAKMYIDRSLSYDSEDFNTYILQGFYYYFLSDWTAAERSYNKSLELNPNYPVAYTFLGNIYNVIRGDHVRAIEYYEQAEKRNRGELITAQFYRILGHACMGTGYFDLAEEYLRKALVFDGDTFNFINTMGNLAFAKGDFKESAEREAEAYKRSQFLGFIGLWNLIYSEQIEEAKGLVKRFEENVPEGRKLWRAEVRGYLSLLDGDREKAEQLFDQFMGEFHKGPKRGPDWVAKGQGHVAAAMICVYRGQKDQAYAYLDELMEMKKSIGSEIGHLENNPMFDPIREEERFKKILQKAKANSQAAHERMRLYLEERGRL